MPSISFEADVLVESRSATIDALSSGYRVQIEDSARVYPRFERALGEVRDYLGRFLVRAERQRAVSWGLCVCVSSGCAFYGTRTPRSVADGIPIPPAELLARIRAEYREGDGPLAALQNALKIARAHPPGQLNRAA